MSGACAYNALDVFCMPSQHDQSVAILREVFGGAVDHFTFLGQSAGTLNTQYLIPSILQNFNTVLMSSAVIIYSAILFFGTINTAHEGQFLGRQWHSAWTPIRTFMGPMGVAPVGKLCFAQYVMLYLILMSVHMATSVWSSSVSDIKAGVSPTTPTSMANIVETLAARSFESIAVANIAKNNGLTLDANTPSSYNLTIPVKYIRDRNFITFLQNMFYYTGEAGMLGATGGNAKGSLLIPPLTVNDQGEGPYRCGDQSCDFYPDFPQHYMPPNARVISQIIQGAAMQMMTPGNITGSYTTQTADPNDPSKKYNIAMMIGTNIFIGDVLPGSAQGNSSPWGQIFTMGSTKPNPHAYSGWDEANAWLNCAMPTWLGGDDCAEENEIRASHRDGSVTSEPSPNQNISITGSVTYQLPYTGKCPGTVTLGSSKSLAQSIVCQVDSYTTKVMSGSEPSDKSSTGPYSLKPVVTAILASVQQAVKAANKKKTGGSSGDAPPDQVNLLHDKTDESSNSKCTNNDSRSVCPVMSSSWWYAGEVFLQLDQQMAQNLHNLYSTFANLGPAASIPGFVQTTNVGGTFLLLFSTGTDDKYPFGASLTLGQPDVGGGTPYAYPNGTATTGPLADPVVGWAVLLQPLANTHPQLYAQLMGLPPSLVLPIQALLLAYYSKQLQSVNEHMFNIHQLPPDALLNKIQRILDVLAANGLISEAGSLQSNGTNVTAPAKKMLSKVFSNLLGGDSAGAANVNGVLTKIYCLGLTGAAADNCQGGSSSGSITGDGVSVIAKAQQVGVDTILSVILSMENVYQYYHTQYQNLNTELAVGYSVTGAVALGLSAAAIGSAMNPINGAAMASAFGTAAETTTSLGQLVTQLATFSQTTKLMQNMMWMPLVMAVMLAMFSIGINLALMMPLAPFILFWGGSIAWVLGTIEAMIAAPILMLGLTHPGGHEMLGHIVPGIRMLLGLLFRPVLMVMGLLVGLVLTYILISVSADGFHVVAASFLGGVGLNGQEIKGFIPDGLGGASGNVRGLIALMLIFVYAQFITKAFHKCFSGIYLFPEKVMQWVGGQGERAGADDLQEISSAVTSQAQQIGQAGQQGVQKGVEVDAQESQMVGQMGQQASGIPASTARGAGAYAQAKQTDKLSNSQSFTSE